jgi:hypothetical protein
MIPQAPQPICWAECLGGCSKEPSREHILSQSTLQGPQISVRGLPFLAGKQITLHKKDFRSNILCLDHNNKLCRVDEAGTRAFEALRSAGPGDKIKGRLFERWLLKLLINMEVVSDFRLRPPGELAEVAFGKRAFPKRGGLYYLGNGEPDDLPDERVTYIQALDSTSVRRSAGGWFRVRRSIFMLAVCNLDLQGAQWVHHPREIECSDGGRVPVVW